MGEKVNSIYTYQIKESDVNVKVDPPPLNTPLRSCLVLWVQKCTCLYFMNNPFEH